MTRVGLYGFLSALLLWPASAAEVAADLNPAPDFKEIYDLIRSHATGISPTQLNQAAVQGLLTMLGPSVALVTNGSAAGERTGSAGVTKARVFEGSIAYLRVSKVAGNLADEVNGAYGRLASSNAIDGMVVDLRYTDGTDYAAAAATADLFTTRAVPLLNWGTGSASSHDKTNAFRVPVAVLVNAQTSRAGEALAAMLRETGHSLILGGRTAGQALAMQDYPLSNGQRLRIAVAPVTMGDGTALPTAGIRPDIDVTVNADEERAYYADAFLGLVRTNSTGAARTPAGAASDGTNLVARRSRMNEAELVREHRESLGRGSESDAGSSTSKPSEPSKPIVNDPALARALDLLKGLAVVRQEHR